MGISAIRFDPVAGFTRDQRGSNDGTMAAMSFDAAFENKTANTGFVTKFNVTRSLFNNLLGHLRNLTSRIPNGKSHNFLVPRIMQGNSMFFFVCIHRYIGYTVIHDRFLSIVCGSVATR